MVSARVVAAPPAPAADADLPLREGFTLELGVGAAVTFVAEAYDTDCFSGSGYCGAVEGTTSRAFGGFAPLSLGIGGFFSEDVALLFRAASTSYFEGQHQWVHAFYGPAVQLWPSNRVMLALGVGLGAFTQNPLLEQGQAEGRVGFAASVRGGYALFSSRNHALRATLELLPGFYERRRVLGTALLFEWQLL